MEVTVSKLKIDDRNKFIEAHLSFIIKTITKLTNKYVSLENDEEFSIALIAFNEAIDKYNSSRGPFLPFAQLVILSRLKNYFQSENKFVTTESIDKLKDDGIDVESIIENPIEDTSVLKDEIDSLKKVVSEFGLNLKT